MVVLLDGQSCCSVERVYVDKQIYGEFLHHFTKIVKSFKVFAYDKTHYMVELHFI
jgi:acyl-CoA reductase-like NAD-dependent aldehyde dehydrogenase